MGFVWELVVGLALGGLVYAVYKLRNIVYFFDDRKIPYVAPIWPVGSDWRGTLLRKHFALSFDTLYKKLAPHKIGGVYLYMKPVVLVRDPEYINRIYTTDFSYFIDRPFVVDEKKDPLDGHLFFLSGEKWKYLRNKLSPIFTSGKLKWMFEQMHTSGEKFVENFDKKIALGQEVDLREEYSRYTTDIITSCAFGIESNAMGDPDSRFREMGKQFFNPSSYELFKFLARVAMPKFLIAFKIRTTAKEITKFFVDVVKQTFEHRLSTGYVRKDFVQLLLEIREKGHSASDEAQTGGEIANGLANGMHGSKKEALDIDDKLLTAQLFVFFVAGFETTASTMYHLTYFLSRNEDCQNKARAEAKRALEKNGSFTYDSLKELPYLDNCISETLRLLPPVGMNWRVCTKDYEFPDGTKIEKGTSVILPVVSTHFDPQYFPEPNKFKPERFESPPQKGTYAPFGDGPRICIGKRFAEVELKLSVAKLLTKFRFRPASTEVDIHDWLEGGLVSVTRKPCKVIVEKIID